MEVDKHLLYIIVSRMSVLIQPNIEERALLTKIWTTSCVLAVNDDKLIVLQPSFQRDVPTALI